jgi:PKD repeat protein
VADFVAQPVSGTAPLTVTFTNQSQHASSYTWTFGDGGTAVTANPTHTYQSAGSYGVSLVVTGPGGTAQEVKSGYITVNPPAGVPTATFSADVVSGTAPLNVTFTAVTSGTVEGWLWDFGDGSTATTVLVVSHTYTTTGVFDVSLTVSNTSGSYMVSEPRYITVKAPPSEHHHIYLPLVIRAH